MARSVNMVLADGYAFHNFIFAYLSANSVFTNLTKIINFEVFAKLLNNSVR